jgi:methylene-tetrahydromethanopterin dehydrogenase
MQVLELKPLKKKKLKLILVESEFPVDWSIQTPKKENGIIDDLYFVSREYMEFVEGLIKQYKPDFAVEDKGLRESEALMDDEDEFVSIFKREGILYNMVGIPEYALNHISSPLLNKKELLKKFSDEIGNYKKMGHVHYNDIRFQQLTVWRQYLKDECKLEEEEIKFKVRESWMMMGVLELAKKLEKNNITGLFICDKRNFDGLVFLADELGIQHELVSVRKIVKGLTEANSIDEVLNSSVLEIMPIKVKKKEREEKILHFFDTDDYCSPFDINMGYDAGFDIVIPYSKMTSDQVTKLVQDAMFSRKVGAPTVYFIGGSDVEEADKIAEKVLNAIVPPFESAVIIDPRGAHTTASAVVAKTIEVARLHNIENLKNKKVAVLGGTGPVGQISAIIAAQLGANVVITSRRDDYVKSLAKDLTKKAGKNAKSILGVAASTEEDYYNLVKDADIIWSVGKAGVQMISKKIVKELPPNKIVVDINLVPPYGIEGMKPNFYNDELVPGIYAIGALDIGRLKYKIESNIFKMATMTKGKKIFDYNIAFNVAQEILFGEEIKITL